MGAYIYRALREYNVTYVLLVRYLPSDKCNPDNPDDIMHRTFNFGIGMYTNTITGSCVPSCTSTSTSIRSQRMLHDDA